MKKRVWILVLILLLVGCSNGVEVPDVYDTDEATAKSVLAANYLIPTVKYENSDEIEAGNVIRTEPPIGDVVDKNTKIYVYVSKGPSKVTSKDSTIHWYNVGSKDDKWEFYSPYIEDDTLKIECFNVVFTQKIEWQDDHNDGTLYGNASINDTFDKTVPVRAKYSKRKFDAKEKQSFTLEIPLKDLNISKPTNMYIELYAKVNGKDQNIRINFTMTW